MVFVVAEDQEFTLPPLEERPLVTFALFAYNQEKYIREAVEGALSQDYEPLEIILSDDFSTDQTYSIIKSMAERYEGKSKIILRQSRKNLGLSAHINDVSKMANGKFIVLGAGDDVSKYNRVSEIAKTFISRRNLAAVYTNYDIINVDSKTISENHRYWNSVKSASYFSLIYDGGGIGTGATYAYIKEALTWPRPIPNNIQSEDRLLPLRGKMLGEIFHLEKSLVKYRIHSNNMSQRLESPAKKNQAHIEELKFTLDAAKLENKIGPIAYKFTRQALELLPMHVEKCDKLLRSKSRFAPLTQKFLKLMFTRYFWFEYHRVILDLIKK